MKVAVEQYVSAKVAKLAKEKGFNLVTKHHYQGRQFYFCTPGHQDWNGLGKSYMYSAPSQAALQKWIREELGVSIKIDDFFYRRAVWYDYSICELGAQEDAPRGQSRTYEEALDKALYAALLFKPSYNQD